MSESLSIDEGWEEPLDSDQVTHVMGEAASPAATSGEWLVNVSEQVVVPMTTVDIVEAVRSRRVTARSLVWRAGMQDWTALGEVPQLRMATSPLVTTTQPLPAPSARALAPTTQRVLHPPSKEPARAARDERARRNTLPFGFPVVRDPATIREPAGLHAAAAKSSPVAAPAAAAPIKPQAALAVTHAKPAAAVAPAKSSPTPNEEVEALAIYERATPSLTFSDSVRAEWQGTDNLVHQPAPSTPAPTPRPALQPRGEAKARLSLAPQSDPKPRLTLEPQSDPLHSARPEPLKLPRSQPPASLAPTTSEPDSELPARGAGMWGDLSVVLASDMRAVKQSSKRVTLIASVGSAMLASLLTLWFARSSGHDPAPAMAAQPAAVVTAPSKAAEHAAPALPVSPAEPTEAASAAPVATHAVATPSSPPAIHSVAKPAAPAAPRVAARPKPAPVQPVDAEAASTAADANPYAEPSAPSEPRPAKTPTAAFKETSTPSADTTAAPTPPPTSKPTNVPSGLEDNASPVHPAPTAAPGF